MLSLWDVCCNILYTTHHGGKKKKASPLFLFPDRIGIGPELQHVIGSITITVRPNRGARCRPIEKSQPSHWFLRTAPRLRQRFPDSNHGSRVRNRDSHVGKGHGAIGRARECRHQELFEPEPHVLPVLSLFIEHCSHPK